MTEDAGQEARTRGLGSSQRDVGSAYGWYVVGVLTLASMLSFVDRNVLSLLVGPIKHDLHLSDTSVSLLLGFAFALFYAFAGLPLGRLADRVDRTRLVAAGVFIWSLMTTLSGVARTYGQLFVCRLAVGVGEATLMPAAYSIIADVFPPRRLGLAMGVFAIGVYLGAGGAFLLGAAVVALAIRHADVTLPLLGPLRSWQLVFLILGLPGLAAALLVATLREPERRRMAAEPKAATVPLKSVFGYLLGTHRAAFLLLTVSTAFAAMTGYSVNAWMPTFVARTYGWSAVESGRVFGWVLIVSGVGGVVAGGWTGDAVASRRRRCGRLLVMIGAELLAVPFAAFFPLARDPVAAFALMAPMMFFVTSITGLSAAALQEMAPTGMRGMTTALAALITSFLGFAFGPSLVAITTDLLFRDERMIRYSLAMVTPAGLLVSALCGALALRPYSMTRSALSDQPASGPPARQPVCDT
jgi:MFS family permease